MKKNGTLWAVGGLVVVGALIGCNLLEPLSSKHANDQDYREILIKANNALSSAGVADNNAKQALKLGTTTDSVRAAAYSSSAVTYYNTAIGLYDSAMHVYPQGSEAFLFHSQAIAALYHLDYSKINDEFKKSDNNKGLPFIHSNSMVNNVDSVYHPAFVAVQDLNHILRLPKDKLYLNANDTNQVLMPDGDTASDGRVTPSVARLDLGILSAVQGLLAAVDMDGNGHIDSTCGENPTLSDSLKLVLCPKGLLSEVSRLNDLDSLTNTLSFDTLDSRDLSTNAKNLSDNPNDITGYVRSMQVPLVSAAYNLDSVRSSLKSHNEDSLAKKIQSTVTRVRDLANFVGYMQYNNNNDDDYDHQAGALQTAPMQWHDYDRDHGIRFDYNDNSLGAYDIYMNSLGFHFGNPGDIGNPFHRWKHPELYLSYGALMKLRTNLDTVIDASVNSRIHLMQKRCNALVDSAIFIRGQLLSIATPNLPDLDTAALRGACRTTSTVLASNVTRPTISDWVGGTPGVDEELLDGLDNDNDGITDEDARNLPGFDDDNDAWALNIGMIDSVAAGHSLTPMQWKDVNGNHCIDIDVIANPYDSTTASATQKGLKRAHCIGTLENRLTLARNAPDSLAFYYQSFGGNEPNGDCLNQFARRLDTGFTAVWQPTLTEARTACLYRSIWVADPNRTTNLLKNSEWTGGTFGIDEEICGDGIDNDGDGWVDEDCAKKGDH